MPKIFLGNLSAIRYLGNEQKEFNRSPFTPKPVVKNGDIIILEKIHAHNLSKLLPTEFEMINENFLEFKEEDELLEIIAEFEAEVKELEAVVAEHDLKLSSNEELLASILNGLESKTITLDDLSDYDKELYNKHLENILATSSSGILEESLPIDNKLKISADEALTNFSLKPMSDFNTKEELLTYAIEEFGFELDKDLELEDMYKSLEEITNSKEDK